MKRRRSVRFYDPRPVPEEVIKQVLEVASYAASGGNSQTVKWLVVSDPVKVKRMAELTVDWMRLIQDTEHPMAAYVAHAIKIWEGGRDFICHQAPHLLFAHIPHIEMSNDNTDGIIAMTCFDIAAPSYGLGTCWAGFIRMALDYPPLKDFIALPAGRKIAYPMMFGYPMYRSVSIPRRNPPDIIWR
jgi:nitroreductase